MTGFDNSHAKQITSSYVGGGGADGSSATINGGGIGSKRYLPLLMFLIAMGSWMMGHNSFMSPPPSCNSVMKEVTTLRTVQRDETNAQPNETDILSQASTATSVDDFSTVAATDSITGPLLKGFLSEEKLQLFQQAKQRLIDQLKSNDYYGSEHFTNLFVDQETGMFRTLFPINDTNSQSYKRFVRKIMIKLLKAASTNTVLPFVWVTSGNSVGAGHGNLFNESYSSIVQKSLHETMSTLNLDLTVRPYAMSASRSAPELAFCQSEVYGQDIDLLVWHFGLTDMLETERMALFLYRMGLLDYATQNDNRPVMMALQIGTARRDVVESIARMGLCILQNEDKDILKLLKDGVPDTFGMTEEQINAMPPYIRNFKCDKRIEEGDPYCSSDKYTLNLCPERLYQTSWHPGWRWNAIMGYLFTFSMFRGLDDAIQTISSSNLTYVHELLNELKQQEDTDYDNFRKSDVPVELMQKIFDERDDLNMVNLTTLAKSPSICHTALLPSESRYRGIATETQNTFYSGIELHQALSDAASRGGSFAEMRLVYTEHLRFRQPNSGFKTLAEDYEHCPVPTTIDYRDYFFLHHDENWKNLIVPNDVELKVYGKPGHEFLGYVAICLVVTCHNGCPAEALTRDEVFGPNSTEFIKLNINGQEVVRGLSMGRECDLLQHHHGLVFPTRKISESDSIGKFEIAAKVMVPNRYLRISSVIVW